MMKKLCFLVSLLAITTQTFSQDLTGMDSFSKKIIKGLQKPKTLCKAVLPPDKFLTLMEARIQELLPETQANIKAEVDLKKIADSTVIALENAWIELSQTDVNFEDFSYSHIHFLIDGQAENIEADLVITLKHNTKDSSIKIIADECYGIDGKWYLTQNPTLIRSEQELFCACSENETMFVCETYHKELKKMIVTDSEATLKKIQEFYKFCEFSTLEVEEKKEEN